jgi:hypothetical protein
MSDETGTPKVIPLLKQDTKATIKQTLAIYCAVTIVQKARKTNILQEIM